MLLYGKFTENKYWEIESAIFPLTKVFNIHLQWTLKGDHCGLSFTLELFNLYFAATIYDCRHWNYRANRFYKDGEELEYEKNDL